MENIIKDYKKYRWFFTLSDKLVIGGKNAIQNDELVKRIKDLNEALIVMHTSSRGSPFSVILANIKKISKNDIEECAVFTASFSRAWKEGKKKAAVGVFNSVQLNKNKGMQTGSWRVTGEVKEIHAQLELALTKQQGALRAVPSKSIKNKNDILLEIMPGKIDKKDMPAKLSLELKYSFSQEEILSALPTGGFKILRK